MTERDLDKYRNEYNNQSFELIQLTYRRKKLLEMLRPYDLDIILEVGCGNEPLFEYFPAYKTFFVIEPDKSFYNIALKKRGNKKNIILVNDYFEKDITEIIGVKFDCIIISGLLHEIPNVDLFMAYLKALANRETIVHINVPNANSLHRLIAEQSGLIKNKKEISKQQLKLQQFRTYDLDAVKLLLDQYGFSVIEECTSFIKPFTHAQMEKCLKNDIIDDKIIDGLYALSELMPDFGSEIFVNAKLKC